MIIYKQLIHIPLSDILKVFNEAFSKYIIPLQLSQDQFEWKLQSENFYPELSVGAFAGNKLIGFILHSADPIHAPNKVYNGGTGVIEGYRGRALTRKMYDFVIPILKEYGYTKALLEVIEGNEPAYQSYLKQGFSTQRIFGAYKNEQLLIKSYNTSLEIKNIEFNPDSLQHFQSIIPSWQNANHTLLRVKNSLLNFGAFINNQMVGYLCYNPLLNRIHQMAVDPIHRKKGIGKALLRYIATTQNKNISIINVDKNDQAINSFLVNNGFKNTINLFEMEMPL